MYYMTLDPEIIKRKLYHKCDIRLLEKLNYDDIKRKIKTFTSNYDPDTASFNKYIFGKYD